MKQVEVCLSKIPISYIRIYIYTYYCIYQWYKHSKPSQIYANLLSLGHIYQHVCNIGTQHVYWHGIITTSITTIHGEQYGNTDSPDLIVKGGNDKSPMAYLPSKKQLHFWRISQSCLISKRYPWMDSTMLVVDGCHESFEAYLMRVSLAYYHYISLLSL